MERVLSVQNLEVRFNTPYGAVHAVNGVSFDLAKGETLGIAGESGCGKSVSCRAIMQLIDQPGQITGGSVWYRGEDLLAYDEARMQSVRGAHIAMIFQDPLTFLNPVMRIGKQIMEPLKLHMGLSDKAAKARAIELLGLVGIPKPEDLIDSYPHQFSGGMCQRAMIAMAISCKPDILIADEPTTALDVTVQIQIIDLIRKLQRETGMSIIWITHDLGVVAGLCDRVNVFYGGRVVESAAVDDLYKRPLHPYTKALFRSIPRIDAPVGAKLETIPGTPPRMDTPLRGCPFEPRCRERTDECARLIPDMADCGGHKVACHKAKG